MAWYLPGKLLFVSQDSVKLSPTLNFWKLFLFLYFWNLLLFVSLSLVCIPFCVSFCMLHNGFIINIVMIIINIIIILYPNFSPSRLLYLISKSYIKISESVVMGMPWKFCVLCLWLFNEYVLNDSTNNQGKISLYLNWKLFLKNPIQIP